MFDNQKIYYSNTIESNGYILRLIKIILYCRDVNDSIIYLRKFW